MCIMAAVGATRLPSVAMCAAAKNEHRDVREWISHHLDLGVQQIHLYDNNSTPPMQTTIADFIAAGEVDYHFFTGEGVPRPQLHIYKLCIERHRHQHDWMAFLDMDEFIVLGPKMSGKTLPDMLDTYRDHAGVVLNWRQFGSSGHIRRPPGGVRRSYTACYPADHLNNRHVKTIANLAKVLGPRGVHAFEYPPNQTAVNTRHEPVDGPFSSPPDFDEAFIYHYVVKSWQDFVYKAARGSAMKNFKTREFFTLVEQESTAVCTELAQLPQIEIEYV